MLYESAPHCNASGGGGSSQPPIWHAKSTSPVSADVTFSAPASPRSRRGNASMTRVVPVTGGARIHSQSWAARASASGAPPSLKRKDEALNTWRCCVVVGAHQLASVASGSRGPFGRNLLPQPCCGRSEKYATSKPRPSTTALVRSRRIIVGVLDASHFVGVCSQNVSRTASFDTVPS